MEVVLWLFRNAIVTKGVKIEEFNDILRKKSNVSCSYLSVEIYNRCLLNFRSKKFLLETKV